MLSASMRIRLVGMCLAILSLLAACSPSAPSPATPKPLAPAATAQRAAPTPTKAPAATPSSTQPKYGGILKLFSFADPGGLDPHQETSVSVISLIGSSYNGFVQYDPLKSDRIIGDLAEKWEVSADGMTYTFHLFKGARFHNGTVATSQDAKYSLDRVRQPPKGTRSPRAGVFQSISKVEAPDENTVVVTLSQPAASLMANLATSWMAIVSKDFVEAKGGLSKDVMGTGPFKLKSYSPGVSYELTKFPDYFVKGRPYLDGISIYIIKDASSSFAAFRTGHIMRTIPGAWAIKASQAEQLKKEMGDKVRIQTTPGYNFQVFQVNFKEAPWNDPRVRMAANLAIDRPTAIKVLAEGEADIGGAMPPLGQWALPKDELMKMPGYGDKTAEIAQARKLLADAGFPDGFKTTVTAAVGPNMDGAIFIKDQLAKIGIDASTQGLEKAIHDKDLKDGRFTANAMRVGAIIDDPDQILSENYVTGGGRNYSQYSDPKLDELYAKQSQTIDVSERKKLVLDIQRMAMEANAKMIVFWTRERVALNPKVKDLELSPSLYTNHKYQDVWLSEQ